MLGDQARHVQCLGALESPHVADAEQAMRLDNQTMAHRSGAFLVGVHENGVSIATNVQSRLLNEPRKHYGNCVTAPSLENFDPADQLNGLRQN
jgi:hypothetical protein